MAETQTAFRFVAAGFGSGWLPRAPGTWGSLLSLPPGWLLLQGVGATGLLLGSVVLSVVGCWVCFVVLSQSVEKDPCWIVIDEWAGQWLCLAIIAPWLGSGWLAVLLALTAFRLFDVIKPWPVSMFERLGPAWWSIMADDLAAGLIGGVLVAVIGRGLAA